MESWRKVWRDGFAPQFSTAALAAMRDALANDHPNLVQGATTIPAPLQPLADQPAECCCILGFAAWQVDGLGTVAQLEEEFSLMCFEADQAMGEPAACRYFLNWYDETPREEMRREMLAEIDLLLRPNSEAAPQLNVHATEEIFTAA